MSSSRPESHVAQQIRRDKLRILESSHHHLQEFHTLYQGFNLDQVRNVRNTNMFVVEALNDYSSSAMVNFSNPLSASRNNNNILQCQELGAAEPATKVMVQQFPNSSSISLGNWRNSATHHQGVDWNVLNYASSSMSSGNSQNSFLASEINNNYQHFGKPSYNELTETQSSSLSREIQKKLDVNVMHLHPSSSYQNALQDIVKSSASISTCNNGSDMASLMQQTGQNIWVGDANELAQLQPSYLNQQNQQSHFTCGNLWTNRPLQSDSTSQSLSLTLSSNSQSKPFVSHFEEASTSASASAFASDQGISKDPPKYVKPTIISRDCGKSPLQDYVGISISPNSNSTSYRNVGPLGPFTGYATILKSSRFLNSAQQLLEEFCCVSDPNRVSEEVSASTLSADAPSVIETRGVAPKGGVSLGSSSSMLYFANENGLSSLSDYQQKKAKLLYMQEEVGWRYKQYHHQMQMVVSSFESVAGLSSASPYVSLAVRSISKHFRCLKNSISDQLKHVSDVLGEDLSVPTTSTSYKVDNNITNPRCMDQKFQKNKGIRNNKGLLLEPQQHVWRPQRGLPEPAVAILKAWLFEHFLHPYPTDNDKHMLATQTGLSRNQVSNWFINARVRVWKPMVEEIHMLETKGVGTGDNQNTNENERTEDVSSNNNPRLDKPLRKFGMHSIHESQRECMQMGSTLVEENGLNHEEHEWSQEKRSKFEFQVSSNSNIDCFVAYQQQGGGVEVEGLGSVSLTLGLRHGVEGVQNQQQLQEEHLIGHFGGHIYDTSRC